MVKAARKELPLALRVTFAVLTVLGSWAVGVVLGVVMHLVTPPIFVDELPEGSGTRSAFALKQQRPGSLSRQARERVRNVLSGEPGIWRFTFPEVNSWLASNQMKKDIPEGSFAIGGGGFGMSESNSLVMITGEAQVHTPFGVFPVHVQTEGAFRMSTSERKLLFAPSSLRLNSLTVPAFNNLMDGILVSLKESTGLRALPEDVWPKVGALTVDSSGVTLVLN